MKENMFDISTLDQTANVTFDVPVVLDADGNPAAGFKVVGRNSQNFRDAERALTLAAVKKAASKATKAIDTGTDAGAAQVIDTMKANETGIAVACTVDWYGFSKDGASAPMTPDALATVFEKRPTWLSKVTSAIAADANFQPS